MYVELLIILYICILICVPDVDECVENLHGCVPDVETCRNTVGAYECDTKCDAGYLYSPTLRMCVGNAFNYM